MHLPVELHTANSQHERMSKTSLYGEFASGAMFAAALIGAGVYEPSIIKGQMDFSSNTMITVFLGASATSVIIMDIEDRLKLMRKKHRAPSNLGMFSYDGNVLGGSLIGIGMAISGACPGTSLVQMGAGMANGFLVVVGGLLGAAAFVKLQPHLKAADSPRAVNFELEQSVEGSSNNSKPLDIASALGIHPITLVLVWIPACAAVILTAYAKDATTHTTPASGLVPPVYGGLLIGTAQLGTTLLTGHAVGASSGYEDVATWLKAQYKSEDRGNTALLTPSLIFSSGVVAAAAILGYTVPKIGLVGSSASILDPSKAGITIIAGACMVFGARLAGGCTSGHGISGLAKFSLASLATTVSMFTAGILTAGFGLG